jgi:ATP-dependent Clp protease ATP-binding subunit ClpA
MSEYMEKHTVSRLIGSPPGYVGYGEGGLLTECVRRNPRAVICFDEAEKAHRDIYGLFLQILEEGELTDSRGRRVDFSGTVIIFTTNDANDGAKAVFGFCQGGKRAKKPEFFSPELCGRIDCFIQFDALDRAALSEIIRKRLDQINGKNGLHISYSDEALFALSEKCDIAYGGRDALRVVREYIEDPLSELLLSGGALFFDIKANGKDIVITNVKGIDKPLVLEYN